MMRDAPKLGVLRHRDVEPEQITINTDKARTIRYVASDESRRTLLQPGRSSQWEDLGH
jgi:hypothetical protein